MSTIDHAPLDKYIKRFNKLEMAIQHLFHYDVKKTLYQILRIKKISKGAKRKTAHKVQEFNF